MPRPLAFLPCERVILGQGDNSLSLISVLETIGASFNEQTANEEPEEPLWPIRWAVFTLWLKEEGDDSVEFEQRVAIYDPTDKLRMDSRTTFVMEKPHHRIILTLSRFPQKPAGAYRIELSLRNVEAENVENWHKAAEYHLNLRHSAQVSQSGKPVAHSDLP